MREAVGPVGACQNKVTYSPSRLVGVVICTSPHCSSHHYQTLLDPGPSLPSAATSNGRPPTRRWTLDALMIASPLRGRLRYHAAGRRHQPYGTGSLESQHAPTTNSPTLGTRPDGPFRVQRIRQPVKTCVRVHAYVISTTTTNMSLKTPWLPPRQAATFFVGVPRKMRDNTVVTAYLLADVIR